MAKKKDPIDPVQRAAMVILSLEEDVAAEVLQHLEESELRALARAVEQLKVVPPGTLEPTLAAFAERFVDSALPGGAGKSFMGKVFGRAFGEERAKELFQAPKADHQRAIDAIRSARPAILAEFLQDEHPQVAAVIISQLRQDHAAQVLMSMREDHQADMLVRIATLEEVPAQALEVATAALVRSLEDTGAIGISDERTEFDGVAFAAGVINQLPTDDNDRLMEELEDSVPDMAPRIREAMFSFEDLALVDSRSLQTLMREIASEQLLIALKTASEELCEKFFASVSRRAATSLREDLELMAPKRLSDVEAAQREIVDTAMRLAADGQLALPGASGGQMV